MVGSLWEIIFKSWTHEMPRWWMPLTVELPDALWSSSFWRRLATPAAVNSQFTQHYDENYLQNIFNFACKYEVFCDAEKIRNKTMMMNKKTVLNVNCWVNQPIYQLYDINLSFLLRVLTHLEIEMLMNGAVWLPKILSFTSKARNARAQIVILFQFGQFSFHKHTIN